MNKPLFNVYPTLKEKVPCLDLAYLPTPIDAFDRNYRLTERNLGEAEDSNILPNLWIKRDDKTNPLYGGNKVRKLEFILAEAKKLGKRELVTFGATGTNHGVATAIYSQQQRIKCRIFLFDQPITKTVQQNLKLMQRFDAVLERKETLFRTVLAFYVNKSLNRHNAYYLFAGGSNIAGCIGYVNAAFELRQQIEEGVMPEPDYIYCPVGSSSTVAGLTLGCQLAGLSSQVVGVRVAPSHLGIIPACTQSTIGALMKKTYRYLRKRDSTIPKVSLTTICLEQQFYGEGYGHPTKAGQEAMGLFSQAGIKLEPTYTAKTAAAALKQCQDNPKSTVLYWHTYNSADMSQFLDEADVSALPEDLAQIATRLIAV